MSLTPAATAGIADYIAATLNSAGIAAEAHPVERVEDVGIQVFFGAWDPTAPPVGIGERLMHMVPTQNSSLPAGDFRDWHAIKAWATDIAAELRAEPAPRT